MAQDLQNQGLEKAKTFFSRAEEVTATGNYDYAIDMYLEGLRRAPDAIAEGHEMLRKVALIRQGKGGKKPSMMDKLKRAAKNKDPIEEMLNNEWLFSRDPDNLSYAESMLKAATAAGCKKTAAWMADMVFEATVSSAKPSVNMILTLKESYKAANEWSKAIRALQYAIKLKPQDLSLADELRNLSAEQAVKAGKYDQAGDFRKSIKDKEGQEKLQAQDAVVKTDDYKTIALKAAREKVAQNPDSLEAIGKLADMLVEMNTEDSYKEAINLLELKYQQKQDFNYKRRAGEIKIKHLTRQLRAARAHLEGKPQDTQAKAVYDRIHSELLQTELSHFKSCVDQYPTDGKMKYEYGSRLMRTKKFDEAIPMLQDAQRDPRYKISSMDKMGLCFLYKGWYADATDIFNQAIEAYEVKDDAIAKDLRYNLARAYEEQGKVDEALELYRKLAQMDFGFKDVRQRVDKLRKPGQ